MKSVIEKILKNFTEKYLRENNPKIIAITGSNGKTSTREAIYAVLKNKYKVRRSEKNYNTEIGVPLSVLGVEGPKNIFSWPKVLINAYYAAYDPKNIPEILILEMAADKPGDIRYLTSFIKPHISVITAIGNLPVHVEAYSGPKGVAEEKSYLVKVLETSGIAILNYDDKSVMDMEKKTKAHVFTYGFEKGAETRCGGMQSVISDDKKDFFGTTFKIETDGKVMPVRLKNVYGKPSVYASLAAFAVGRVLGMNLIEIAQALEEYRVPKGRLNLIKGINDSDILDDTYNASPLAMFAALDVLNDLEAKRKIVVVGDMKELGKYSEEAHISVGREAAKFADIILAVGDNAEVVSKGAVEEGFSKENIFEFKHAVDAGLSLKDVIHDGDLILAKGSQSMRMELVVEQIMAHPEKKKDLLVRQDWPWKDGSGNPRLI